MLRFKTHLSFHSSLSRKTFKSNTVLFPQTNLISLSFILVHYLIGSDMCLLVKQIKTIHTFATRVNNNISNPLCWSLYTTQTVQDCRPHRWICCFTNWIDVTNLWEITRQPALSSDLSLRGFQIMQSQSSSSLRSCTIIISTQLNLDSWIVHVCIQYPCQVDHIWYLCIEYVCHGTEYVCMIMSLVVEWDASFKRALWFYPSVTMLIDVLA